MNRSYRTPLFALALAAASWPLAAAADAPTTRGVEVDNTAERMIQADAAADAERRRPVGQTTDEAEAPMRPDRVGQVSIEEISAADDLPDLSGRDDPAADAALDGDDDGVPDDDEPAAQRE